MIAAIISPRRANIFTVFSKADSLWIHEYIKLFSPCLQMIENRDPPESTLWSSPHIHIKIILQKMKKSKQKFSKEIIVYIVLQKRKNTGKLYRKWSVSLHCYMIKYFPVSKFRLEKYDFKRTLGPFFVQMQMFDEQTK